jgi:DNA processing protein
MSFPQSVGFAAPQASRVAHAVDAAERIARLRLARSENIGPRTFLNLVIRFGSAQAAIEALPALAARGGRAAYAPWGEERASEELARGSEAGARILMIGDEDYPARLLSISNPPPVLWLLGDAELFTRPAVAMVGARNASALGLRLARRLAGELGSEGQVVVSGLARGIDAAAHEAALATGTIGVLAGGIDRVYPEENADLARRMAEEGGALVSECAIGIEPTSRHFPRRNRLVSGLADGVVLVEAATRSGSLITARSALEQGREVMACPGTPEDPRSGGCNQFIRDGAALVRSGADVIEALEMPRRRNFAEPAEGFRFDVDGFADASLRDDLAAMEDFDMDAPGVSHAERVLALLGPVPVEADELARAAGLPAAELSLTLLELEIAGRIEMSGGNLVSLAADDAA